MLRAYTEQHQHTFTHSHFKALGRAETKKEAGGGGGGGGGGVKRRNCVEERIESSTGLLTQKKATGAD